MSGQMLASAAALLLAASTAQTDPVSISSPGFEWGALERTDGRSDDRFRDVYRLNAQAGAALMIVADGDAIALLVTIEGAGFRASSGPETNGRAELEVSLPREGDYLITVTSVEANQTGEYGLSVLASCSAPGYLNSVGVCVRP